MISVLLVIFITHPRLNHIYEDAIHSVSFLVEFYRNQHKSVPIGLRMHPMADFLRYFGIFDSQVVNSQCVGQIRHVIITLESVL